MVPVTLWFRKSFNPNQNNCHNAISDLFAKHSPDINNPLLLEFSSIYSVTVLAADMQLFGCQPAENLAIYFIISS